MSGSPSGVLRLLANGPMGGGDGFESHDGVRRVAEFERQIENLDQKEMELHQTQLKLMREQTHTFLRDLAGLRQEVAALRQWQEKVTGDLGGHVDAKHRELLSAFQQDARERDAAHQRLATEMDRKLKKAAEDLSTQHGDNLSKVHDAMGKLDYHHGSLNQRLENLAKDVEIMVANRMTAVDASLKELRVAIGGDKKVTERDLQAHHASLSERMAYLEKAFGDSADKHQRELDASLKKIEQLHGKLSQQSEVHKATMEERMNYVEKIIGDSADKHAKELAAAHAKLQEVHNKVGDLHKDKAVKDQHHATVQERLDYVEKLLGDSADRHAAELAALRAAHEKHLATLSKHAKDLEGVKAGQGSHGSVADRLAYLEKQVGSSFDKHAEELSALKLAHDHLHGRLSACETQSMSLSKSHASLSGEKKSLAAGHSALKDRLDQLEAAHGDLAHKHSSELESLKDAHGKHLDTSAKLSRELAALKAAQVPHATMSERIAYMEKLMGDSADKHNQELAAAHAKIEQMHGRVCACEKLGGSVEDLRKSHGDLSKQKNDLLTHHANVQERLKYIEALIGDSADKHAAEIARLRAAHDKHVDSLSKHGKELDAVKSAHVHHASMEQRLDYLEKLLGDSADKHAKELAAAAAKVDALHGRLSVAEKHGAAIGELRDAHSKMKADRAALDAHHASVAERVAYVEKLLGDSADKHAKEVRALKDAHAKHAGEVENLKAAHVHHATVEERLNYMEKVMGDSADKHARELAAAHAKLEQLHGRLGACESASAAVGDLKRAHSGLANQKAALEAHHASLRERVDYLENMLGDSADRHTKMLEAAHAKLDQLHGRVSTCEKHGQELGDLRKAHGEGRAEVDARHASMQERMNYIEHLLGDSADKHAKEIDALKAAHDKHLTSMSKHAKELESLKVAHAHHASFAERLVYLEQLLGDSADRHAAELAALHQKTDVLHGKLAEERDHREKHHGSVKELMARESRQRDEHHASVKERVGYLETILGDNADRHAREVAEAKSLATKLASEVKSRDAHHSSIAERLTKLERSHGEGITKAAQEIQTLHAKVDSVYGRIASVKSAWSNDTPPPTLRRP